MGRPGDARVWRSPVGSLAFTSGPDVGDLDVNIFGVRGGARLGVVANDRGTFRLVPTFGLDVAYDRVSTELAGIDASEGETYGIARLGVGLLFNRRISLVPVVSMPFGLDGSDVEFAIVAAFSLGSCPWNLCR